METIGEFASSLLEEAKRFLERAKMSSGEGAELPNLHASLMLAFCSLEAHINAVADEFSSRPDLSIHERALLLEKKVEIVNGAFCASNMSHFSSMEDRIEFLHQRFSKSGALDLHAMWRSNLSGAIKLRNKLTHPKTIPHINISAVEQAVEAVVEAINSLYLAVYGRAMPAANLGLASTLDF